MKVFVNNRDRTEKLKERIADGLRSHVKRDPPNYVPAELNALELRKAGSQTEYLAILTRLIRYRDNVDTVPFDIPHRGGLRGQCSVWIKKRLWNLLRYQLDRITFRQNLINSLYTSALEYEWEERRAEIACLESRIAALEKGVNDTDSPAQPRISAPRQSIPGKAD